MPLILPANLPAIEALRKENIYAIDEKGDASNGVRPIKIAVLNLMPLKIMTELDLLRLLSNTPLTVKVDLIETATHVCKNTPREHMLAFYKHFDDIKGERYDGLIVTGAPVEKLDFEAVDYWEELCEIFDWAKANETATLYLCWAALAGLYYYYGIPKQIYDSKISGVFKHRVLDKQNPIFRGFDDEFFVPHSRFCGVSHDDVMQRPELKIISEGDESGVYMVMANNGKEIYITGHSEYSANTLDFEYHRDLAKGINPKVPVNYYEDNDPSKRVIVLWRGHANLLFTNWLNYFVNPSSPYSNKQQ